jgi:hypothetical protein
VKQRILIGLAGTGVFLAMSAPPALAAEGQGEEVVYTGRLTELNGSGGSGEAVITVAPDGETLTVAVKADGLNLDAPHAMHLHGIVEDGSVLASTCPTMADDADGDGVLTVVEGVPRYGGVQVSLTTGGDTSPEAALAVERFPVGTEIEYSRSGIEVPVSLVGQVSKLHVVVHGFDENGNGTLDLDQEERSSLTDALPREAVEPALCGTLTVAAGGPIQTGAGGTVPAPGFGQTPRFWPAALAVLAGLSGAAVLPALRPLESRS